MEHISRPNSKMIDNREMMLSKWIIFVVISLTVAGGKCNDACECELSNITELGEYLIIAEEITDISCYVSNEFIVESSFSAGSLPNNNSNVIFKYFTPTCKRYTDILAFKDQLQKVLLINNQTLSNDTLLQLTSLIIDLQTAAMKLQNIERKMNESYCVTFTSEQYELIYFSRQLQMNMKNNNLVRSLCIRAGLYLQNKKCVCNNWARYK